MSLKIVYGDITKIIVDAIVNAANTRLSGGEEWMERFTGLQVPS